MTKAEEILEKHTFWQGEKAVRTEEDMLLAMQEYGKYCAEQAWAFVGVKTFNEWWAEFQKKEETK